MDDQFDVSLEDDEMLDEVELTANLMVAANRADRPLSQQEIDEVLGVRPELPRQRTVNDRPDTVRH
ncbi:hypothetical protein D9V37_16175 [Nocardioides mangrovicus]|uniref:Uncharacterized protein n=1 Tax=Nocardioides mangrovicus TaxID=2478913 RepID=A0A3L8NX05_9ACTN|nr:hypothetical protein [Nocardioides mangrovicus]RLV47690.1 hypothetical protein D9V37_16175 [Nocardioides mangrovicus]